MKSTDCKFIQQEINDRKSTIEEDAEIIDTLFFNTQKFEELKTKVDEEILKHSDNPNRRKSTDLEKIYIAKVIHDFKLTGKKIRI